MTILKPQRSVHLSCRLVLEANGLRCGLDRQRLDRRVADCLRNAVAESLVDGGEDRELAEEHFVLKNVGGKESVGWVRWRWV